MDRLQPTRRWLAFQQLSLSCNRTGLLLLSRLSFLTCGLWLLAVCGARADELNEANKSPQPQRPNVLFIAFDDLNDWIGSLGGHPQTLTPNLDRLAKSGVLFTNAHCAAASCNPSRTAIFTGLSPHRSGIYANNQPMRQLLPDTELLPKTFSRHGYRAIGSGKMLHYFIDAPSWDEYFPSKESENPFPRTLYPETRPVSLPRDGDWQYVETDWGPLPATDEQYGGDYLVTQWVSEQLSQEHPQPFFLACGIYRPHEPWFVPQQYFEPFPLESIQLPPGYREDDLDDLPPEGKRRGPNRYLDHIREHGQWKQGVQSYLASIHFADAMLGRVLDALESGPNANNTIVVAWSDHGWHLGEKEHWQKYTAWRACTRVPLIVRVPQGAPGLPEGTKPTECDQPVSLLSLYPTLLDLAGLPSNAELDGPSFVPLLADPNTEWPHYAITHLGDPGSFGLSARDWRLIQYANGEQELYHIANDPYEWDNLAGKPEHQSQRERLTAVAPKEFAPRRSVDVDQLPVLTLKPVSDNLEELTSSPRGVQFPLIFENQTNQSLKLLWVGPQGGRRHLGTVAPGESLSQPTRQGVYWLIETESGDTLGVIEVDRVAGKATVARPLEPFSD